MSASKTTPSPHKRPFRVPTGPNLPRVLGGLALVLALAGLLPGGGDGAGPAQVTEAQKRELQALAAPFVREVESRLAKLRAVTEGAEVSAAAETMDGTRVTARALRAADPDVLAVRLLPRGHREVDYDSDPPLTYAVIELLEQAEAGKPARLQVLLPGGDEAHGALVLPLGEAEPAATYAFIALDPDFVRQGLSGLEPERGRLAVVQAAPGVPRVELAAVGTRADGARASRPVPGTAWRLVYALPDPRAGQGAAGPGTLLRWALFAGAALLGVAAVVLHLQGRRRPAAPAPEKGPLAAEEIERRVQDHMAKGGGESTGQEEEVPAGTGPLPLPEVEQEGSDGEPKEEPPAAEPPPAVPAAPAAAPAGGPPQAVFRAYDIRGEVAEGAITADLAREVGLAVGSEADERGQKTLVVGRDGRLSSVELSEALIEGLQESGREVIDLGRVPTPVVYFACHYLDVGSGVMVTGSHNPGQYNGFKVMLEGETLAGEAIQGLRRRIIDQDYASGAGSLQHMDIGADYIRRISEDIPVALGNAYKLVVDCANGVTGELAPRLYRALGHDVVDLYCTIDGRFPNHPPDPSDPANLQALIERVRSEKADLGLAFDGDGDRIAVVDGRGRILWPDRLLMAYARDVLPRHPGAAVVFDVKSSNHLARVVREAGGTPQMWRSGHSMMKARMVETGAPVGGEMSGHIFFKERWYGFDDGLYAGARLLELLQAEGGAPAAFFDQLPGGVATPELRAGMAEGEAFSFMERFPTTGVFPEAELTLIDGVRADFPGGWGLLRASNTTPSLVFRFEADDEATLKRIQGLFREEVLKVDPALKLPF